MTKIKEIKAIEILDSRGNPTVQVTVELDNGLESKASVPSGASTGVHEALELRDQDEKRYGGKGVLKAVENVNKKIATLLKGREVNDILKLDSLMLKEDGTENKSKLGANAILGVSLAVARVGALDNNKPLYQHLRDIYDIDKKGYDLPIPLSNIVNGGEHADNNLDWQEFWIIPAGIKDYPKKLRACAEVFHTLAKKLKADGHATNVGDEGGYAPQLNNAEEVWEYIQDAIKDAGYKPGKHIYMGMDAGSSEFYNKGNYELKGENITASSEDMILMYQEWVEKYPIFALEDPLDQDDWDGWQKMTGNKKFKKIPLIGDDLFVTNVKRLQKGINENIASAILIKVNQIGSVSETMATIKLAQENNYKIVISHRSGETTDDFIADLAVAVNAEFIKTGATSRGERVVKYNRLLEIHNDINNK